MDDKETSLAREELAGILISAYPGGSFSYVFGLDMGSTCWMTIAAVLPDDTLIALKVIPIALFDVITKVPQLAKEHRCRMGVCDHGPYTETVYRLQQIMPNLFAGIYSNAKGLDLYKIKDQEEDKEQGRMALRQVNIARDKVLDLLMSDVRAGKLFKVMCEYDDLWMDHLTDMKRLREFRQDELVFTWKKVSGADHCHHSLLYAKVASFLLGVSPNVGGGALPLLSTFRMKPKV